MIKANFNAYASYVTDSLHQWDIDQVMSVSGLNLAVVPEVHFSNANTDRAIVRQATMKNHVVSVGVPNSLLQDPLRIYAHIGIYEGSTFKVVELVEIPVMPRKRPADYQIQDTDEEIYSFKQLENAIANMVTTREAAAISARIDTIVANANSTDGNSELVDIRVDESGETYPNAGAAVRARMNGKTNGYVYPAQSANVGVAGNGIGGLAVTVYTDRLVYILPGATEYGGIGITAEEALTQLPNYCEQTAEGYLVFTVPEYSALCFDTSARVLRVKGVKKLSGADIVLVYNAWENLCGGSFMPFIDRKERENLDAFLGCQKTLVYVGSDSTVEIEKNGPDGSVKILLGKALSFSYSDGDTSTTGESIPVESVIDQLGAKAEAYGDGVAISLVCYQALCFNHTSKKLVIRHLRNIKADDIVLLHNAWANIQGPLLVKALEQQTKALQERVAGFEEKTNNLMAFNSGDISDAIDVTEKCTEFAELFSDSTKAESFVFFTDPHLTEKGEDYAEPLKKYMVTLEKYYKSTPTSFVVCGGDWLGNSDTRTEAKYKLGYIDGIARGMFDNFHHVVGNHDTNYQGVDEDGNKNSGRLGNQTIANLWNRKHGRNYYAFDGENTRFYVLDTGTDWETEMTAYRWEQVAWLADQLRTSTAEKSALLLHIGVIPSGDTYVAADFTSEIFALCEAYNKAGTVTLNGVTYDFTDCTGRVAYGLCGHVHADTVLAVCGIPLVATTNMRAGSTPTFELCLADYDANVLHLVRVGSGESRSVNMTT